MKKPEKEKKRKRRGQVNTRGPDAHLIRVALRRDPTTGRRVYHNETFHGTRAEAEKRCTQLLAEVDSGAFFRPSGLPLRRDAVSAAMLKPLLKRAGLPETYSPYTLRRSFSSQLRRAGVSAKEVSEQMGHTSPNFTDRVYVTVYDSAKREMSDKLGEVLSGAACTQEAHNGSGAVM